MSSQKQCLGCKKLCESPDCLTTKKSHSLSHCLLMPRCLPRAFSTLAKQTRKTKWKLMLMHENRK